MVCLGVFYGYGVNVDINAETLLHIGYSLFDNREGLQAEEVHLDETCILNHTTLILCHQQLLARLLIISRAHRYPIGNIIATDDSTAGVYTRATHIALEHLGILNRIAQYRVGRGLRFSQLGYSLDSIGEVELLVGKLIGDELTEVVSTIERQLLHTRHILQRHLRGHSTIGDDMCHLLGAVLLCHPAQHFATAIIVKVHIDIRERYTVGVEETLKQQVIFNRVNTCNLQAISHGRTRSRATARAYRNAQQIARSPDKVLHDEEVSGETHRLHDMKFEDKALLRLRRHVGVVLLGAIHRELLQIVSLQLDTIQLIISTELLYLSLSIGLTQYDVALLIAGKLIEEILLGILLSVSLLSAKLLGNLKVGHDGRVVDGVKLHLVTNLHRVGQRLGYVAEDGIHLLGRLHPLLLRVEHTLRVIQVLTRREADEAVVSLSMLFIYEVYVIGTHQAYAEFLAIFDKLLVHLHLHLIRLMIGTSHGRFVKLQLQVVVLAKGSLVPLYSLFGLIQHAACDHLGNLTTQTCRTYDKSLLILLQLHAVGTRAVVETLGPRL